MNPAWISVRCNEGEDGPISRGRAVPVLPERRTRNAAPTFAGRLLHIDEMRSGSTPPAIPRIARRPMLSDSMSGPMTFTIRSCPPATAAAPRSETWITSKKDRHHPEQLMRSQHVLPTGFCMAHLDESEGTAFTVGHADVRVAKKSMRTRGISEIWRPCGRRSEGRGVAERSVRGPRSKRGALLRSRSTRPAARSPTSGAPRLRDQSHPHPLGVNR